MVENKEKSLHEPEDVREEWFEEITYNGFRIDKEGGDYEIIGGAQIIKHKGKKPSAKEQFREIKK